MAEKEIKLIKTAIDEVRTFKDTVDMTLENYHEIDSVIEQSVADISQCIDAFNSRDFDSKVYLNITHTQNEYTTKLPSTSHVLKTFQRNYDLIINHFRESTYLNTIWKIESPKHLITNIVILIYRTTLLETIPGLKEKNVQISSTIEELSLFLKLNGSETTVYNAVKLWLADWEEEGFSAELAKLLTEQRNLK